MITYVKKSGDTMGYIKWHDYQIDEDYILLQEELMKTSYNKADIKNPNYFKCFNINELIGSKIAKEINLRTVDYYIAKSEFNDIILSSPSFKRMGYVYLDHNSFLSYKLRRDNFENHIEFYLSECINDANREEFLDDFFKLLALDTYMMQKDRCGCNLTFEINEINKYLRLAPIYDYEQSFERSIDNFFCRNPLWDFMGFTEYSILMDQYPIFREKLKEIQEISLKSIIENIELEKHIIIPDNIKEYYENEEKNSLKLLQKILN